jgi:peptide-methionine (R)-S-oxide reductase
LNCGTDKSAYIFQQTETVQGETMVTRREVALGAVGVAAVGVAGLGILRWRSRANAATESFEVTHTPEEWRKLLTPAQYAVLREQDTERAFTSPLNKEHRKGIFTCAGCDLPLFSSETKFDSGTGWPSFYAPLENAVRQESDFTFGMVREEVHCRRCGGHLGHVFDDGPPPTGKRYCMNGVALKFVPA